MVKTHIFPDSQVTSLFKRNFLFKAGLKVSTL